MHMKRPEDRQTPGRKRVYEEPVRFTVVMPAALLEAIETNVDGTSKNRKVVNALLEYAQSKNFPQTQQITV